MREIPVTGGKAVLVSDKDYPALSRHRWRLQTYAYREGPRVGGRRTRVYMHRELLGLGPGDVRQADHINRNTLDNRRENLRIVTAAENGVNRGRSGPTRRGSPDGAYTSRFRGVSRHTKGTRWEASIRVAGKKLYLGLFEEEEQAAREYDRAALEWWGPELAQLNFSVDLIVAAS